MAQAFILNNGSDEIIKKQLIKPHKITSIVIKDLSHFVNKKKTACFLKALALTQVLYKKTRLME